MLGPWIIFSLLLIATVVIASVNWTVSDGQLLKNNVPVVLRGFAVTCMEYLLNGIGT